MHVAVTGANGFVGKHLSMALEARGDRVTRVVRNAPSDPFPGVMAMTDVLNGRLGSVDRPLDAIVHTAAVRHRHGVDEETYRAANVNLVEDLIRAASGKAKRFVLVSSVGIYGWSYQLPIGESHPFSPRTLYGRTKVEAEAIVRRLCPELGMEWVILRPCIIYGSGDNNGMMDKMARMIRAHRYLLVGNGSNVLHHVHIDDVVGAILAAIDRPQAANNDFIVAGPETTTLRELSERVAQHLGQRLPPVHIPLSFARGIASVIDFVTHKGIAFAEKEPPINNEKLDVMTLPISFDTTKLRTVLGYVPRVPYAEGIQRTLSGTPSPMYSPSAAPKVETTTSP